MIALRGLQNGQQVSAAAFPDQYINVQEQRGLVKLPTRQLAVALPLPQRIDQLIVELKPDLAPQEFEVEDVFRRHCKDHPADSLCVKSED